MTYKLDSYARRNMSDGQIPTRDQVDDWLGCHAGDFRDIKDFAVSWDTHEIPWENEENDYQFSDIMYPVEG